MSDNEKDFIFTLRCINCDYAPTIEQVKKGEPHCKCKKAYTKDSVGCDKYNHDRIFIAEEQKG